MAGAILSEAAGEAARTTVHQPTRPPVDVLAQVDATLDVGQDVRQVVGALLEPHLAELGAAKSG